MSMEPFAHISIEIETVVAHHYSLFRRLAGSIHPFLRLNPMALTFIISQCVCGGVCMLLKGAKVILIVLFDLARAVSMSLIA